MFSLIIVSLLLYSVAGNVPRNSLSLFQEFKAKYQKSYGSVEEEKRRLGIFMSNMDKAEEMNRANPYAEFGITKFSDLTEEEFKSTYANGEKYYKAKQASKLSNKDMITYTKKEVASSCTAIDWRKKGAVTAVKDQGNCGCDWAFSVVGAIEGQWFVSGHPLISLSVQELVSCDGNEGGCLAGNMDDAFKWLLDFHNGQIVTEASFPYVSNNGNVPACPSNFDNYTIGAHIKGFTGLPHDESQMASFVCESGPVSISVASLKWYYYKRGIMTNCFSKVIDHFALIVGFDKNYNPPYWIIKNSWGADWGEDGYIRVAYGSNQCGINIKPMTPIIASPVPTNVTLHPVPSYTFYQMTCDDAACSENCSNKTYPLNTCIPLSGNGSALLHCTSAFVKVQVYLLSKNCTGKSRDDDIPVKQCFQDGSGTYFKKFCVPVY